MFTFSVIPFLSAHLHWIMMDGLAWLHMPTTGATFRKDPDILIVSHHNETLSHTLAEKIKLNTAYIVETARSVSDCEKWINNSIQPIIVTTEWDHEIKSIVQTLQEKHDAEMQFLVMAQATSTKLGKLAEDAIHSGAQTFIPQALGSAPLVAYLHRLMKQRASACLAEFDDLNSTRVTVNQKARIVRVQDQKIYLPRNLFALFLYMAHNRGKALSYQQLTQAQKEGKSVFMAPNTLVVKMYRLRGMFEHTSLHHRLETVPGYGYRYTGPEIQITDGH
ncbi:winged helix-turn-helix domain-containing protein [Acidithiobacillus montserratensis]|uniref:Winged helix-turn-helix domain-containing protein n=1 Tax=Acidithiobacillus montserratensis TaxID=2729135 RepID=A0ACD5HIM4_9PROT|nr:winged helix-turn-helix domain-containing protein [Acidithiobacillus montserratensis]MBN2679903.1 winged helix-turn-helix domain-containing protein [Acidithiobacillaceae bacterium]MBU2746723.1 hypothetical protein [Acidithiobacillus montserratensis]